MRGTCLVGRSLLRMRGCLDSVSSLSAAAWFLKRRGRRREADLFLFPRRPRFRQSSPSDPTHCSSSFTACTTPRSISLGISPCSTTGITDQVRFPLLPSLLPSPLFPLLLSEADPLPFLFPISSSYLPPDLGKVLIGIQVPSSDYEAFDVFLEELAYPYKEETNNPVYLKYLKV